MGISEVGMIRVKIAWSTSFPGQSPKSRKFNFGSANKKLTCLTILYLLIEDGLLSLTLQWAFIRGKFIREWKFTKESKATENKVIDNKVAIQ